jgi:dihydroorotase
MRTGILDAIAIDHAPYTYEEKTVAFAEAPPGAIGLELALPLLWHNLVDAGDWSALELWRCLSSRPAECLQQIPSTITPGKPAELTLFDPQQVWKVEKQTLHSLAVNTSWLNQELKGRILQTWL